jgi:hypothetical protein
VFLDFVSARFVGQGAFAALASSERAVLYNVTSVVAAEADGQLTLGSGGSRFATGVAEGGGLAVA